MAKKMFRIGRSSINLSYLTSYELMIDTVVPIWWNDGAEGGDGVFLRMFPNTEISFSEAFLQTVGWSTLASFGDALDEAMDALT